MRTLVNMNIFMICFDISDRPIYLCIYMWTQEEDVALSGERGGSSISQSSHRRRMFKNHMHVYRMRFDGEPVGVKDRDAASQNGIIGLITSGDPKLLKIKRVTVGWGLNRYSQYTFMDLFYKVVLT